MSDFAVAAGTPPPLSRFSSAKRPLVVCLHLTSSADAFAISVGVYGRLPYPKLWKLSGLAFLAVAAGYSGGRSSFAADLMWLVGRILLEMLYSVSVKVRVTPCLQVRHHDNAWNVLDRFVRSARVTSFFFFFWCQCCLCCKCREFMVLLVRPTFFGWLTLFKGCRERGRFPSHSHFISYRHCFYFCMYRARVQL